MTQARGKFITIEGVEGVGKSTNMAFIEKLLGTQSIPFVSTREPGGTMLGEKLRDLLLDKTQHNMTPITELLLMFAARSQHVAELIEPALAGGQWVLCDRFTDSSYAYQGGGRGIDRTIIAKIEQLSIDSFQPDCTIILDLPVDDGLERAASVAEKDRFEIEQADFFDRVRAMFLQRASNDDRYFVIDAGRPLEEVQDCIKAALQPLIESQAS